MKEVFDIDRFVGIPRNDGSQYINVDGCCTIGAAYFACHPEVNAVPTREVHAAIVNWYNDLTDKAFEGILIASEDIHIQQGHDSKAVKMVIDYVKASREVSTVAGLFVPLKLAARKLVDAIK